MRTHHTLAGTMLAAATLLPGLALAGSPAMRPVSAELQVTAQRTVSLRELAASAANIEALKGAPSATEMPRHGLPDWVARRAPAVLPVMANANVAPSGLAPKATATGFTGIYGGSNAKAIGGELEPPDQGLAVNGGKVLEVINNSLQVFDTSGNALSSPVANATFFNIGKGDNLSDPHSLFDVSTQRWFVEELVYSSKFTGFEVAVSQTADPLGSYYVYRVSADTSKVSGCGKALCFPDYPQVGYDANGFFIGSDLFSNSSGQFISAGLYVLPKAVMETGASIKYTYFLPPEFVLQPSIPAPGQAFDTDLNGTEFLMTARNIYDGSTNVRVYAVSNTANIVSNPGSLYAHYVDVAAETYTSTVPSTEPNDVGPYGLSQGATTSPMLDGGYNAFGGGVKYANGQLFAALTSGSKDKKGLARDVIAWFAVTPSVTASAVSAKIAAQGFIVPPTGFSVSYPAFALAKGGKGYIGGSIANPNAKVVGGFPSTWFTSFTGHSVGKKLTVVGKGTASDDGFTGYSGSGPAGVGRWGDYSAGMVDATTGYYYFGNEYIPDVNKYPRGTYTNWGTFVTQVK